MPIEIRVGLGKKVGTAITAPREPRATSRSRPGMICWKATRLTEKVKNAFAACSRVVQDELGRQQTGTGSNPRSFPSISLVVALQDVVHLLVLLSLASKSPSAPPKQHNPLFCKGL